MSAPRHLSITKLYEDHVDKLKLSWVGAVGAERRIELKGLEIFGPDIVGHLNLIYCHRVQVIGKAEQCWIERTGIERWNRQIEELIACRPPAIIVADGLALPGNLLDLALNVLLLERRQ